MIVNGPSYYNTYIYIYISCKTQSKTITSLYIYNTKKRIKVFCKNGKDVAMTQKGQKQEGMLCGAVLAVWGLHLQRYCTISLHLAALHWHP